MLTTIEHSTIEFVQDIDTQMSQTDHVSMTRSHESGITHQTPSTNHRPRCSRVDNTSRSSTSMRKRRTAAMVTTNTTKAQHYHRPRLSCSSLFLSSIIFVCITLTVAASKKSGLRQQRFEMEPLDKTAIVGDTVILPCRVENKKGTLQWTRDGFGLGTERSLEGFQRYRMIGSDDEGDYSLEISPVALEDDAVFQCQVGAVDGVLGIRSRSATFTVQVQPEPPVIVVTHAHSHAQVYRSSETGALFNNTTTGKNETSSPGEMLVSAPGTAVGLTGNSVNDHHLRTTAGMTIELTCEAHGGRPPAELSWMDNNGNAITNGVAYSTTKLNDGKRWNAALKWSMVANRALDGQRVTCRSENAALKSPRYAHIQLEVRYPPEVELRLSTGPAGGGAINEVVREGDDLTLECIAVGNPARMTFKWTRDGVPLGAEGDVGASGGDGTPRLVFRRVGREFHGTVIACEVANSVGTSRAKLEVKVAFKPRFVKPNEPVIGITSGEIIKLECNIDAFPKPAIIWSRYAPKLNPDRAALNRYIEYWQEVGDGTTIEVGGAGRYRCIGKSEAFEEEVKSETLVFIKGPPLIRSPTVQFGMENEAIRLQCVVEAIPPPTKITWFKVKPHQQILGIDNNEGYEILEEEDPYDYSMSSAANDEAASSAYLTSNDHSNPYNVEQSSPTASLVLLRSIIYIRHAKESDFGQYNCSVWNQYGFRSQIITLQKQTMILSPLILTLSGIIGAGIVFVIVSSLVVFACIRGQRLRADISLAPKKLENSDDTPANGMVPNGSLCNGTLIDATMAAPGNDKHNHDNALFEKKMNTINSLEKSLLMKNTIMKMNGSNQVLTTLANGTEVITPGNGVGLPVYSEYEYNYSYPNELLMSNGGNGHLNNNYSAYDNLSSLNSITHAYSMAPDYRLGDSHPISISIDEKSKQVLHNASPQSSMNPAHLYSTVIKPHHLNATMDHSNTNSSNYAPLLSTNASQSHHNISSNNVGLPSVPPASLAHHHPSSSMVNSYSASLRSSKQDTSFANPYLRTSNPTNASSTNGLPMNHYNNVDSNDRLLSAGVYNAQQHNRYKTNSLGGGSSSSGVISNGGSSPGHSPVGSVSGQTGTHV